MTTKMLSKEYREQLLRKIDPTEEGAEGVQAWGEIKAMEMGMRTWPEGQREPH
jgi:hypothetical protein